MGLYKLRTEFSHQMKWLLIIIAFGFLVGGLYIFAGVGGGSSGHQGPVASSDVIATVGEMQITKGEMETAWEKQVEMLRDQGMRSTLQFAQRRAELFKSLLSDRVTLAIADELGVKVSDKEVNKKIDEVILMQLKASRKRIMGKMSATEEKTDPRDDRLFATELSKARTSVSQIEDNIRLQLPEDSVRSQLAQQGIQSKIKQRVGTVTSKDINDSYNVYTVRQIIVPKGNMPVEQLKTRVDKIVSQAKSGSDFAALAKQYSQDKGKGGAQSIAFDQVLGMWMMTMRGGAQYAPYVKSSLDIWNQVSKLKPGQVGTPIDTDQAVYITKVENMTQKLPAKFDKKAQKDRKVMIEGLRVWQESLKVEQQVRKNLDIKVTDPECLGYWELSQMGQNATSPAKMKQQMNRIKAAFTKAVATDAGNAYATAMLAVVLAQTGDSEQAITQLYHLLEGPESRGEGSDLRMMLGDLLWQSAKSNEAAKKPEKAAEAKNKAIEQYIKASENSPLDATPHQELVAKFKQVGRPDLAAKEQQWLADFETKRKLLEAEKAKNASAPSGR